LAAAHWVSAAAGGHGAVRELCDALLRARAAGTSGRTRGRTRARARARSH
jgi:3-deoxy-D-manno-octulosonate 8-phosphate phosphatase KdsC-like HAD superfamily phosphatase